MTERKTIYLDDALEAIRKLPNAGMHWFVSAEAVFDALLKLPSAEPETAKRIVGCARNGMTMWYQCDMCHEPVDEKDAFCRGCGRRFEDE